MFKYRVKRKIHNHRDKFIIENKTIPHRLLYKKIISRKKKRKTNKSRTSHGKYIFVLNNTIRVFDMIKIFQCVQCQISLYCNIRAKKEFIVFRFNAKVTFVLNHFLVYHTHYHYHCLDKFYVLDDEVRILMVNFENALSRRFVSNHEML